MLRLLTFVSFSLIATSGFAQQFTDVTAEIGLDGLSGGTVSFVDFNNDCKEDLVVSNGYITSPNSTHDL